MPSETQDFEASSQYQAVNDAWEYLQTEFNEGTAQAADSLGRLIGESFE